MVNNKIEWQSLPSDIDVRWFDARSLDGLIGPLYDMSEVVFGCAVVDGKIVLVHNINGTYQNNYEPMYTTENVTIDTAFNSLVAESRWQEVSLDELLGEAGADAYAAQWYMVLPDDIAASQYAKELRLQIGHAVSDECYGSKPVTIVLMTGMKNAGEYSAASGHLPLEQVYAQMVEILRNTK
jgi:hypothetical protein